VLSRLSLFRMLPLTDRIASYEFGSRMHFYTTYINIDH
jgi:hypothetical protein